MEEEFKDITQEEIALVLKGDASRSAAIRERDLLKSRLTRLKAVEQRVLDRRLPHPVSEEQDRERRAQALIDWLRELVWSVVCEDRVPMDELTRQAELAEFEQALDVEGFRRDFALLYGQYFADFFMHSRLKLAPMVGIKTSQGVGKRMAEARTRLAALMTTAELRMLEKGLVYSDSISALNVVRDVAPAPHEEPSPPAVISALRAQIREVIHDSRVVLSLRESDLDRLQYSEAQSLDDYHLGRFAKWVHPRYALDSRFVSLELFEDMADSAGPGSDRWRRLEQGQAEASNAFTSISAPASIVVGSAGGGKTTLLQHLELQLAQSAIRNEEGLVHYVPLNEYAPSSGDSEVAAPREWLVSRWADRYPLLPDLDTLLSQGGVTLLLDGLNEIHFRDVDDYHAKLDDWRRAVQELVLQDPGNRVIISCRRVEDGARLSEKALRVPQIRIAPLNDVAIEEVFKAYHPATGRRRWQTVRSSDFLDLLRIPFYLRLYIDEAGLDGNLPEDRAALIATFVRKSVERELGRANPIFLRAKDLDGSTEHLAQTVRIRSASRLEPLGALYPALSALAMRMHETGHRLPRTTLTEEFQGADGDDLIRLARDLAILDHDPLRDEITFVHPLLRAFFAGRRLALEPAPELASSPWKMGQARPRLEEVIEGLAPSDLLPMLDASPWDDAMNFACSMSSSVDAFMLGLADHNLAMAGALLDQPGIRGRLSAASLTRLFARLIERTEENEADPRERIRCGVLLGRLGDPRLITHGEYQLPEFVEIPAGRYPIGSDTVLHPVDQAEDRTHCPEHEVSLHAFEIARYPVTRAEWAYFVRAGGYRSEGSTWWTTQAGKTWHQGVGTAEGNRYNRRYYRKIFIADPHLLDELLEKGSLTRLAHQDWCEWIELADEEFEDVLESDFPDAPVFNPRLWNEPRWAEPSFPVVGICWYEAQAYCAWLSEVSGQKYRLPTEVEWEAAARGTEGREYPWGDEWKEWAANTAASHVRRQSPVGAFPGGSTPEGIADLVGNVLEWTSSAFGDVSMPERFLYPYDATDGREVEEDVGEPLLRVQRGSSWSLSDAVWPAWQRAYSHPASRGMINGLRLVRVSRPTE